MIAEVLIRHLDVMRFSAGRIAVVAARGARTIPDVVGKPWRPSSWKRPPARRSR
jgi:hypothetical protein